MNQHYKFSLHVIFVVLLAGLGASLAQATPQNASAPSTNSPAATTSEPQFQEHSPRYTLKESDSFDLNFELSPEFNQAGVLIQPDGFVTLRGVGDVRVQGQTVSQATDTIRTAYSKILHDPIISITLKDFQKPFFIADGQLGHPGRYELRGDITLTEGIALAGGFLDSAKHSQVLLFRRINDQWTSARIINVKEMHKQGNLKEDLFLRPGDMLFVPKNTMSKIKPFIPTSGVGISAYNAPF